MTRSPCAAHAVWQRCAVQVASVAVQSFPAPSFLNARRRNYLKVFDVITELQIFSTSHIEEAFLAQGRFSAGHAAPQWDGGNHGHPRVHSPGSPVAQRCQHCPCWDLIVLTHFEPAGFPSGVGVTPWNRSFDASLTTVRASTPHAAAVPVLLPIRAHALSASLWTTAPPRRVRQMTSAA